MAMFQVWLVSTLVSAKPIGRLMHTRWGWPAAESIHFLGLSLLVGTIVLFDLRLLGMARRISIAALHKLVPWGLAGYAINLVSGACFLMAEPDQYIYNPAFHFKMLFMAVAGFNATSFYLVAARRTMGPDAEDDGAARGKDHRGDVDADVDWDHRVRPAVDVLSPGRLRPRGPRIPRLLHPANTARVITTLTLRFSPRGRCRRSVDANGCARFHGSGIGEYPLSDPPPPPACT